MALKIFKLKNRLFLIILITTMAMTLNGQNLKEHLWENRIVLIITSGSESETYTSQIEAFNINSQEFDERKLIIYKVLPNKYKVENSEDNSWVSDSRLYALYNSNDKDFKIILIGLDGNIKIEQSELLTTKDLFATIDSMPMRRSELRNKP